MTNNSTRILFFTSLLAGFSLPASAQWHGYAELASDRVERGVSQSDGQASAAVGVGWTHGSGLRALLGASTVSSEQFSGSKGYKLSPEIGWERHFGDGWRGDIALRAQYFPGVQGQWYGSLSPRAKNRVLQAQSTDYSTAELALAVRWKVLTLSWSRSLTDYLGASATETEGTGQSLRQTLLETTGTQYLALDLDWPAAPNVNLLAGVGRLQVPNLAQLSYTDWRLGVVLRGFGLHWGLQASGSNAGTETYRSSGSSSDKGNAATTVRASVGWHF